MKRILQIKIIAFVLSVAVTPILLLSVVFLPKYSYLKLETGRKFVESVKKNEVAVLQGKFENIVNMGYKFSVIAQQALVDGSGGQNRQVAEFEKELMSKTKGIDDGYILTKEGNMFYAFTERRDYEKQVLAETANLIFKDVYVVKGIWSETGFYYAVYRKIVVEEQLVGYVVLVVNRFFFDNDVLINTKEAEIDIYNGLYDIIATNTTKKIFSREINEISKAALEGSVETKNVMGKTVSMGFVELGGDDIYMSVALDKTKYLGNDKFIVSFAFAIIFSMLVAFLLAWKFIGYVNEYVDKAINLNEYDESSVKKLVSDLDINMQSVDRVLNSVVEFQVLKQDMIKLRERFFRGHGDDKKNKK